MKSNKSQIKRLVFFALIILILTVELPLKAVVLSGSSQVNPSRPTLLAQSKKKRSTWEAILNLFKIRRKESLLGSRSICFISLNVFTEKTNVIWSTSPLFLWQETTFPFEIRLYSPPELKQKRTLLWRQEVPETSTTVNFTGIKYDGTSLEPGKSYELAIFNQEDKSKNSRTFKVMGVEERERIAEELRSLQNRLKTEKATNDEIVLERVNYFVERNLWSDALQEMYASPNPSRELIQNRQELLTNFCPKQTPSSANLINISF